MGLLRKAKAIGMPEEASRAPWTGYEELPEPEEAFAPPGRWLLVRAIAWMAFLSAAALSGYLLLSSYFMFRFYPNTYINDTDVSGMTVLEAGDALAGALAHDVSVTLRCGTYAIPAGDLGLRVSYSPAIGVLASGQSGFPWVRHDLRCEAEASYDKTEVLAAVNALLEAHPEDMPATAARVLFEEDGSMAYRDGTGAYKRDDAAARDYIVSLAMAGAWEADISALDCYDTPYALLPDAGLEDMARQWNARFSSGVSFLCGGEPHALDMAEASLHASRSGRSIRLDGDWLRETVDGWTALEKPAGGFSVRGVPVRDEALPALHAARKLAYASRVAAAFRDGSSGVELDTCGLGDWLQLGCVLSLDGDAGWAVLYRDGEAAASCAASFHNGSEKVSDVLAASMADGKIVLSDGFTVGGAGCNIELDDFDGIMAALGSDILRCAVSLSQEGHPAASHAVPEGPAHYQIDFAG